MKLSSLLVRASGGCTVHMVCVAVERVFFVSFESTGSSGIRLFDLSA